MNPTISASAFRKLADRAKRGKRLEDTVISSQADVIRVEKIPNGVRYLPGGKTVPMKGPVDFMGEVVGSGRSIVFDAKECDKKNGFYLDQLKPHQLERLVMHGKAGAIAGIVVEATRVPVGEYLWLSWKTLAEWQSIADRTVIPWISDAWVSLGDNKHLIRFENIPGVTPEKGEG